MSFDEAVSEVVTGLLKVGACSRNEARERAERLLDEYLRDPMYRVEGVDVPAEFVNHAIENL